MAAEAVEDMRATRPRNERAHPTDARRRARSRHRLQPMRDKKGVVSPALGVKDPKIEQEVLAMLLALNLKLAGGR